MKSILRYECVFDCLHASLVTSLANYRNCCEELLSPFALPDTQLDDLFKKVDESSWADSDLDSLVRERLHNNYLPFKLSVKQLNKKIILLARKLKLDKDFRVCRSHGNVF
jgi:hypothetical protein